MSHGESLTYILPLVLLSTSLLILIILLFLFYRRKPIVSHETQPIKRSAITYSLADIDRATDGFNPRRIIGKGRLGAVYAAVLESGQLVAVKRIHSHLVLGNAGFGFSLILKSLSLARHPHIIPILGFSEAPGERIIVSEFVGVMSLEFCLHHDFEGAARLDWSRRFRIAAGAARGLEYLHEGVAPQIVHGCIKCSNVLIDVNFCSRVCDYGLSFLGPKEKRGLLGYVDDEYWAIDGGRGACKESDVYGFGVVLLELLSGRSNEDGLLVEWVLPLIKERKLDDVLDPRLVLPSDMKPLVRLAKVAIACVGNSRKNRPSISQVATILNNLEMEVCI